MWRVNLEMYLKNAKFYNHYFERLQKYMFWFNFILGLNFIFFFFWYGNV